VLCSSTLTHQLDIHLYSFAVDSLTSHLCVPKFLVYRALIWWQYHLCCKNSWCKIGIRTLCALQENDCNVSKLFLVMDFTLKLRMAMYTIPQPSSQQLPASFLHICPISAHYYYYFCCHSIPHSFSQRVGVQYRHSGVADNCLVPAPCAYSYSFLGVVGDNLWLCSQLGCVHTNRVEVSPIQSSQTHKDTAVTLWLTYSGHHGSAYTPAESSPTSLAESRVLMPPISFSSVRLQWSCVMAVILNK